MPVEHKRMVYNEHYLEVDFIRLIFVFSLPD